MNNQKCNAFITFYSSCISTFYQFQIMSSDIMRVKLHVKNNIYSVKIAPSGVTDILMKGLESNTVKAIMRGRPESVVTGQFANAIEVLSAVNLTEMVQEKEKKNDDHVMEIEVCNYFYLHLLSTYILTYVIFVKLILYFNCNFDTDNSCSSN